MVVEMPHCLGGAGASPKDNVEKANVDAPTISLGIVIRCVRPSGKERLNALKAEDLGYDVEVRLGHLHMPSDRADPRHFDMCSTSRFELRYIYGVMND